MARPKYEPIAATRQMVQLHATVGTAQGIIADILGIDDKTLRKHYREELDQAKAKANATIGGALFNKAKGGDTAAMIFWMKTQAGWHERIDIANPAGEAFKTEEVGQASARLATLIEAIAERSRDAG